MNENRIQTLFQELKQAQDTYTMVGTVEKEISKSTMQVNGLKQYRDTVEKEAVTKAIEAVTRYRHTGFVEQLEDEA